jgi:hypothetical protein
MQERFEILKIIALDLACFSCKGNEESTMTWRCQRHKFVLYFLTQQCDWQNKMANIPAHMVYR